MHQIKAQKLDQLIGPHITRDSSPEILKTAVPFQKNRIGYNIRKNRRHFFRKPKTNCQKNENPQTDTDTKIKNPVIQRKNWKPDLKNSQNRKTAMTENPQTENLKALFSKGSKFLHKL